MAAGGKGFILFARSQPDTPGKLAAHAYSYEALELAGYQLLRRVAERSRSDQVAASKAAEPVDNGGGRVFSVFSPKGGVGRTTMAVNLAVGLVLQGAKVGLMDADMYGPNVPMMMGVERPPEQRDGKLEPAYSHGVKLISMGFFVPEDTPLTWRGPMIHTAIQQFLRDVIWGDLDYLVVDLPPGTGDAQLSIAQLVPLTGAVIVTTPQEVALHDSRKGLAMFQKVNVPILGIIENMSYYVCGKCGERTEIFSYGGGERDAEKLGIPFLGRVPIDPAIRVGGDIGLPLVVANPDSPQAKAFMDIASRIAARISVLTAAASETIPVESLLQKIKKPLTSGA